MKMIPVQYLGFAVMDRRFSAPMMPWIIAEIKMRGISEKMFLTIADGCIKGHSTTGPDDSLVKELVFSHHLHDVKKYSQMFLNNCTFLYLMLDPEDHNLLNCYLYLTQDPQDMNDRAGLAAYLVILFRRTVYFLWRQTCSFSAETSSQEKQSVYFQRSHADVAVNKDFPNPPFNGFLQYLQFLMA